MHEKVLVALDFSEVTAATVDYACQLVKKTNAEVTFLHVVPEPSLLMYNYAAGIPQFLSEHQTELVSIAEKKMDYFTDEAIQAIVETQPEFKTRIHKVVIDGDITRTILDYAEENHFNMIVLGYKGHSTMERILIGSTLSKVVPHAPCSVMIYHPPVVKK